MIFGRSNSKMVSGSVVIDLPNSVLSPEWMSPDIIIQPSVITGKRNFISKGDYSKFKLQINLFEYSDPVAKFKEITNYLGQHVVFYPHNYDKPVTDKAGHSVLFLFTNFSAYYLADTIDKDVILMDFIASGYSDISGTYYKQTFTTEDGQPFTTEDGTQIILDY